MREHLNKSEKKEEAQLYLCVCDYTCDDANLMEYTEWKNKTQTHNSSVFVLRHACRFLLTLNWKSHKEAGWGRKQCNLCTRCFRTHT